MVDTYEDYYRKRSIGGLNMFFDKEVIVPLPIPVPVVPVPTSAFITPPVTTTAPAVTSGIFFSFAPLF